MIAIYLSGIATTGEITLDVDRGVRRIRIMIFILPLILEARFVHRVIVDHEGIAHLHRVVRVRLVC